MIDLNSSLFYKAYFTIRSDEDALWQVVLAIRNWIISKHNKNGIVVKTEMHEWSRFKNKASHTSLSNDPRQLYIETLRSNNDDSDEFYWACRISESNVSVMGAAPRRWNTDIGVHQLNKKTINLSYVVSYSDATGYIGLCDDQPKASIPRVVRLLLNNPRLEILCGNDYIKENPTKLIVGDGPDFWMDVLKKDRELPIILVSPEIAEDGSSFFSVEPYAIAETVLGNGLVYFSEDPCFLDELNYYIPHNYRCLKGSIRLYYPDCNPKVENDSQRHRYISKANLQTWGIDKTLEVLRRALCQDIKFYESDKFVRIETCEELNTEWEYHTRLASTREDARKKVELARKKAEQSIEDLLDEAIENESRLKNELEHVRIEKRFLEKTISELKTDNYSLQSQINAYLPIVEKATGITTALDELKGFTDYPESSIDVARIIMCIYPNTIDFTNRGWVSLEECDKSLSVVWQSLTVAATTLRELYLIGGQDIENEFDNRVSGYSLARGLGPSTRKDNSMMRNYIDTYEHEEISVEAHIRKGVKDDDPRMIRIYYSYIPRLEKVVISYVGSHLKNSLTRGIK